MYWGFGDCLWVYRYVSMSFRGSVVLRGCVWGLSPCRIQSGWRQTNQFSTTKKGEIVFSWRLIDIKISKPPLVSFPKMVGFYHFLWFWHLSQRNYNCLFGSPCHITSDSISENEFGLCQYHLKISYSICWSYHLYAVPFCRLWWKRAATAFE